MDKINKVKNFLWIRYEVFDNRELTGSDIMVYAALMRYMNNTSRECYPSIRTLKKQSRLSQRTIYQALDKLEEAGLIHRKCTKGQVNHYVILEPPVQ